MVEVTDFPVLARVSQRGFDPCDLLPIHERAVEREEPDVVAGIRVVTLAVHVVRLVRDLFRRVVVSERRLEFHACREQGAYGCSNFLTKSAGLWLP